MPIHRRHRYILLALGIYWPFIFILTHIPVSEVVRQSGMSDKTMHTMAYLVLTLLVCLAVSPYEKIRWGRFKTWGIVMTLIGYGILDELLQVWVGRSGDVVDFLANLCGIIIGMGILSILSFWSALLILSAFFIFAVNNLSSVTRLWQPKYHLNMVFHFTAYTAFTLIWIQYYSQRYAAKFKPFLRFLIYIGSPIGLLLFVNGTEILYRGKDLQWLDLMIATAGITATSILSFCTIIPKESMDRK